MTDEEIKKYESALLQLQTAYEMRKSFVYNVSYDDVFLVLEYIKRLKEELKYEEEEREYYQAIVESWE